MSNTTLDVLKHSPVTQISLGLKGLESYLEHDTFIYVLRVLYGLIFKSKQRGDNKFQLQCRLRRFEKCYHFPGFLSAAPIDDVLKELEDAQYFYPVRHREVTFPTFH